MGGTSYYADDFINRKIRVVELIMSDARYLIYKKGDYHFDRKSTFNLEMIRLRRKAPFRIIN